MKQSDKQSKKNGYQSDDDNIRYKINKQYLNSPINAQTKQRKNENDINDDDNVLYKFPTVLSKPKPEIKPKPKIKVNFWSNKHTGSRLHNTEKEKQKSSRRHTVAIAIEAQDKPKPVVKVRKRVSFLPSPLFSDNHVPMVTVPDDLTIQLNEEEAHTLRDDLNQAFVNSDNSANDSKDKRKSRSSLTQTSPRNSKRKRSLEGESRVHGNENELEFFSKYVVQKLRKMETNQRIYSENLINTVLMLGQLGELNGKSKIAEA